MNPSFIVYHPDEEPLKTLQSKGYNPMVSITCLTHSQFEIMRDPKNKVNTLIFDANFDYYIPRDWEKTIQEIKIVMWYCNDTLSELELKRIGDYFSAFFKNEEEIKFGRNEGLLKEFTKPPKIQKSEKFQVPEKRKANVFIES